jgi:hypothetical protein
MAAGMQILAAATSRRRALMPDLVTLAYVKALLPAWTKTDGDESVAAMISGASAAFLSATNRTAIAATAITETRSGDGSGSLILRESPVISIQSLSIGGRAQGAYSGSGIGYALADNGFELLLVGSLFCRGIRNIAISYTAGWQTIPADIQLAVAEWVLWKRAKMPRIDQTSISLGGAETTSFDRGSMPPFTRDTIASYTSLGGFTS